MQQGSAVGIEEIKSCKAHVRRIIVKHPEYARLERELEDLHQTSLGRSVCDGMFIGGESGMGKSTLLQEYASRFPAEELDDHTRVPVVYVRIPVGATPKTVASRILKGLGDPLYDRGTQKNMEERIDTYVQACEVEMIMLDEFQHLIDSDTEKVLSKASNWVKLFAEDIAIPVVLCGMPSSKKIFQYNQQLDRRFCNKQEMIAFGYRTVEEQRSFRNFLYVVDKELPFDMLSGLAETTLAEKFYYISMGIPFYIMKVLQEAAVLAVRQGATHLDETYLQMAQNKITLSTRPFLTNPFNTVFQLLEALETEKVAMKNWTQNMKKR